MDVLAQLNRAMAYLEAHMEDDGAAADVSSVTTYSPYHFGRLFYYVAGMPLSEYIRKRRLSLAAMRLQSGNERVLDLALLYGYDSADSFTRAFVRQHGCTPSEARKPGAQLTLFPSLVFQIQIKGVEAMHWRMEERDAFEVFGIERRIGCEDNGRCRHFGQNVIKTAAMKGFLKRRTQSRRRESRVRFAPSAATKRRTAGRSLICSAR